MALEHPADLILWAEVESWHFHSSKPELYEDALGFSEDKVIASYALSTVPRKRCQLFL